MSVWSMPGFRVIGGALVLATVAVGVWELGSTAPQDGGALPAVAATGPASVAPASAADVTQPSGLAGAQAQPDAGRDVQPGAVVVPVDPAVAFMNAVKAARDLPQPAPPPGVAQAQSLPEAFEAMRKAQQARAEPPLPLAGVSPFAAPAR